VEQEQRRDRITRAMMFSGSSGVVTRQNRPPSAASMEISPARSTPTSQLVNSTQRGPMACNTAMAALTEARSVTVRPVSHSNSNRLGVAMSARGMARSRRNSGMPGRTKTPRPTSPITGSQQ